MREIVLDTETTGLDPADGHRIVEIGCLELINHVPTAQTFHAYLNPQRPMPAGAQAVHGLTQSFLQDKPLFAQIHAAFLAFIADSPLIIHNAPFDLKFLNAELTRVGATALPPERAIDTLVMARRKFPGSPNSLDALCRRFDVDTAKRSKHGALIDSLLLAEVYLELIGGRQPDLDLAAHAGRSPAPVAGRAAPRDPRPRKLAPLMTPEERRAHETFVAAHLGPDALWRRWLEEDAPTSVGAPEKTSH